MRILHKLLAPLVLGAGFATPAVAAPGELDPAFGDGGNVVVDFWSNDHVDALRVLDDGRILAVSLSFDEATSEDYLSLTRRLADGSPDPGFGVGGTSTAPLPFALPDPPLAAALQPDGKALVAGHAGRRMIVARVLGDGTPDASFSDEGFALGDYGYNVYAQPAALTVQADGKVVVVGKVGADTDDYQQFLIARFNPDGSPDGSFGTAGPGRSYSETGYAPSERAYAVAVQPDGRIVAAGDWYGQFALARYNANGTPDTTFGCDGFVTDAISVIARAQKVALAPNGAIVVAGRYCDMENPCAVAVVRYLRDGAHDPAFGIGGRVNLAGLPGVDGLAVQPDGAIVVVGNVLAEDGAPTAHVFRLAPDGTFDQAFSNAMPALAGSFLTSIHVDGAGGLLAAGWREGAGEASTDALIARFLRGTDGAPPPALPAASCVGGATDDPDDEDAGAPGPGLLLLLALAALRRRIHPR